eukprot:GHVS01097369.1.p1 GENE.GHVS01097369.1~~GHVS01097369.1.p1  ORF type:complete len:100 (-),score=5.02 GHVS01097369.1:326-625(-)
MAGGARFQPFRFLWRRYNWHSFFLRKEKFYTAIHKVSAYSLIGLACYLVASVVMLCGDAVHASWLHYVKKEQERKRLVDIIRKAREDGLIGASKVEEFQ